MNDPSSPAVVFSVMNGVPFEMPHFPKIVALLLL